MRGHRYLGGAALLLAALGAALLDGCETSSNNNAAGFDAGTIPFDSSTPVNDSALPDSAPVDAAAVDAADAAVTACDQTKPFGTPTLAPYPVSALTLDDYAARLSADELTTYLMSNRNGRFQTFTLTRATTAAAFTNPTLTPNVNFANAITAKASPTADGLTLYVESDTDGDAGEGAAARLYAFSRSAPAGTFTGGLQLDLGQSTGSDFSPFVTADGTLYFSSDRSGTIDGYTATKGGDAGTFAAAVAIAPINLPGAITLNLTPSADGLTLYFFSNRADPKFRGGNDIWVSRRVSTSAPFGAPTIVEELNTAGNDEPSWLSPDGCTLFYASAGAPGDAGPNDGRGHMFQATRPK